MASGDQDGGAKQTEAVLEEDTDALHGNNDKQEDVNNNSNDDQQTASQVIVEDNNSSTDQSKGMNEVVNNSDERSRRPRSDTSNQDQTQAGMQSPVAEERLASQNLGRTNNPRVEDSRHQTSNAVFPTPSKPTAGNLDSARVKGLNPEVPDKGNSGPVVNAGDRSKGAGGGVSVTVLTLDAPARWTPRTGHAAEVLQQQILLNGGLRHVPADIAQAEMKLVQDLQVSRKNGRKATLIPPPVMLPRDNLFLTLELSGTKYFSNGNTTTPYSRNNHPHHSNRGHSRGSHRDLLTPLDTGRSAGRSPPWGQQQQQHADDRGVPHGQRKGSLPTLASLLGGFAVKEEAAGPSLSVQQAQRAASKDRGLFLSSPNSSPSSSSSSSPTLTWVGQPRVRAASPFSLLGNHFGFSSLRPDTFSGIQRHQKLKMAVASGNDTLVRELEQNAQRQILACQNMGYTHRGSRLAESVLGLRQTVSPSAFHPPPVLTRHAAAFHRGAVGSLQPDTAGDSGSERTVGRKQLAHPPSWRVRVHAPRLLQLHQGQEDLSPRAQKSSLPTVHGNALQALQVSKGSAK